MTRVVEEQPNVVKTTSSLDQGALLSTPQGHDVATEKVETLEGTITPKTVEALEKISERAARGLGERKAVIAGVR